MGEVVLQLNKHRIINWLSKLIFEPKVNKIGDWEWEVVDRYSRNDREIATYMLTSPNGEVYKRSVMSIVVEGYRYHDSFIAEALINRLMFDAEHETNM